MIEREIDLRGCFARMRLVVDMIAAEHHMTAALILGRSRWAPVVAARHEAMAACHAEFGYPTTLIGRFFNRDHSTIVHALQKMRYQAAREKMREMTT